MTETFTLDDLCFALDSAADFIWAEEWPEDDGGIQDAANKEASKLIYKLSSDIHLGKIKYEKL